MEYSKLRELFPEIYAERESSCKDTYEASRCADFFEKFDCLNEGQGNESISSFKSPAHNGTSKRIPKILHFIWLGTNPLVEKSRLNISCFARAMQEQGGISVLWTDQANLGHEYSSWLQENSIHLMKIDTVFGGEEIMPTFYHYKAALAKIPPNFGEASDLLRYEIIDQFGGYYFDHDVKKGDVDLSALLSKGKNNQYGFVCGEASDKEKPHLRNDLFGAAPRRPLMKHLKTLILDNYNKKKWKSYISHKRSFLADFTVFTTGPEVFGLAIGEFIGQGRHLSDQHRMDIAKATLIRSKVGDSEESWVYARRDPKPIRFFSNQDWLDHVRHDLMLHLIYEEKILDLEKYQPYSKQNDRKWLVPIIQNLVKDYPSLIESVDRIFVGDAALYVKFQEILEIGLNKKISWNNLAVMKFACMMEINDLVRFFLEHKNISAFEFTFADVGYYDCSNAQPFSILIETGNIEMVRKILDTSCLEQVRQQGVNLKKLGLIYAGCRYAMLERNSQIPALKIKLLDQQRNRLSSTNPGQEKLDQEIKRFQAIQQLLDQYRLA